ncbi:MAG: hypothetical protein AAB433_18015 [Nitrospirota bacterium]
MPSRDKRERRYHTLSNDSLEKLRADGDDEAEGVLQYREIVKDFATNPHTQYAEPRICIAPCFWLRFEKDSSRRVRIWLEVDESLTIAKIEKHLEEIRQWQRFLCEWQGPEGGGNDGHSDHLGYLNANELRISPPPWLNLKKDSYCDRRIRMYIELDEPLIVKNIVKNIKPHWDWILKWRRFLREEQGPERGGRDGYLNHLDTLKAKGLSYSEIAERVACGAIDWLEWYRRQGLVEFEMALTRIDSWSEEETRHWESECSAAFSGFRIVGGCDSAEIRAWWKEALKAIRKKEGLSMKEMKWLCADRNPVSNRRIIDALRAFRSRYGSD